MRVYGGDKKMNTHEMSSSLLVNEKQVEIFPGKCDGCGKHPFFQPTQTTDSLKSRPCCGDATLKFGNSETTNFINYFTI